MASIQLQTGQAFNLVKIRGRWVLAPNGEITDPVLTFDDLDMDYRVDDGEIGASENDIGVQRASGNYIMIITGTSAIFYSSTVISDPQNFDFHAISRSLSNGFADLAFCYAAGTLIETPDGPIDIANLAKGDMVVTRDAGNQPIRWIGHSRFSATQLALKPNLIPIRIRAGALGPEIPSQDLIVSPQHRMIMRGWMTFLMFDQPEVLVPAKALLNDKTITQCDPADGINYYHLLLNGHQLVSANGSWSESLVCGDEALKAMSSEARAELNQIFPDLEFTRPADMRLPKLNVREGIALTRMLMPN